MTLSVAVQCEYDAEPTTLLPYEKVVGISGNASSVGSDTLSNLMTLWSEAFVREYPNVQIQTQSTGSATAPIALMRGTVDLGPMSRKTKQTEID